MVDIDIKALRQSEVYNKKATNLLDKRRSSMGSTVNQTFTDSFDVSLDSSRLKVDDEDEII